MSIVLTRYVKCDVGSEVDELDGMKLERRCLRPSGLHVSSMF